MKLVMFDPAPGDTRPGVLVERGIVDASEAVRALTLRARDPPSPPQRTQAPILDGLAPLPPQPERAVRTAPETAAATAPLPPSTRPGAAAGRSRARSPSPPPETVPPRPCSPARGPTWSVSSSIFPWIACGC